MAWYLALQGPPNKIGQSLTYELHDSADLQALAQDMSAAATIDRVVAVPTVYSNGRKAVTVYIRPAAWGAWAFYEMSDEERRQMMANNPVINAIAQAAKQQQTNRPQMQNPGMLPPL